MPTVSPEPINEALLPLIVDEGQQGWVEGVVVRLGHAVGVLADDGVVDGWAASLVVMLGLPASIEPADIEGSDVTVSGRLANRQLLVSNLDSFAPRAESDRRSNPVAVRPRGSDDDQLATAARRSPVESALMSEGALLDVWQPNPSSDRRVALATDVDRVRRELSPHLAPGLDIVRSRWSAVTLAHITSVFTANDLTCSFGNERGPDGQLKIAATLLHLPLGLARRLSRLPVDAMSLTVLVKPMSWPTTPG